MSAAGFGPPQNGSGATLGLRRRLSGALRQTPSSLLLVLVALLVLGPLAVLGVRATANGGQAFKELFAYPGIGKIIWNTFSIAVGSTIVSVVLGVLLAWCVSRLSARLAQVSSILLLLPLMMPAVAGTAGWIFLFAPTAGYLNQALRLLPWVDPSTLSGPVNVYSLVWIIVLTGINHTGFVFLYVQSGLATIGGGLTEAAAVSGANGLRMFRTITLPLLTPAITYSTGIVFLLSLGQFTNPLLLGEADHIDVLSTVLFRTTQNYPVDYGLGAAAAAPLILVGIIALLAQQRVASQRGRYVVVTGKNTYRLEKSSPWGIVPVILFTLIAVVLPFAALVLVAFSRYWSGTAIFTDLTTVHVTDVLSDPRLGAAIATTAQTFAFALVIVIPLGFISALIVSRSIRGVSGFTRRALDLICSIPVAMPHALVGFAMLYTFTTFFNLYGTNLLIILTFVLLMIPHALRSQLAAMHSVGSEFAEASRSSGASGLRTLLLVQLPMVRRGVVVAAAVVLIQLFQEFGASLLVVGGNKQTLATLLYQFYSDGTYPQVAVLSLALTVVTAICVSLALLAGGTKGLGR